MLICITYVVICTILSMICFHYGCKNMSIRQAILIALSIMLMQPFIQFGAEFLKVFLG